MDDHALRAMIDAVRRGALPRRRFFQQMAAVGVAAPLANLLLTEQGLAQTQPSPYKPSKAGGAGPLRILMWQAPTLLNPHFATGLKDQEGSRPFYEALMRYDADANPVPILAAEIPARQNGAIAADGRSTTWKLKRGVEWHDGRPFTADDVIFNWRYATDPATGAFTIGVYENLKTIEKLDAHTVRFVFEKPTPLWAMAGNLQLIPQHLFAEYAGAKSKEAPINLKPVGTGPYRFVEFKPGDIVRGVLNPRYHMPNRPHFDSIEIKGGGDAASAARAVLQTREYDFAWNLLVEDEVLRKMETGGKGRVVVAPGGDTEFIQFNMADPRVEIDGERSSARSRHPILADRAVRQALAFCFDGKAVQDYVYGRGAFDTPNVLNNPARYNSPNVKRELNPEKANALLDAAGWKRGAGGVREKDGRKLGLLYQTSINPVRQKVQSIFKQACTRAGIDVELKAVPASVFFSSDAANPDQYGRFLADLQMYTYTRVPDPSRFMQQWVSWEIAGKANQWLGNNRGRWANDEYDALFKAQEVELDPVKRTAMFIRMNDLVCNDCAVIPVANRAQVNGLAQNLSAPMSAWDVALAGIHDWYREA